MSILFPRKTHIKPLVWVVDSDFTGEVKAREGVAERLNSDYEIIPRPNGNLNRYFHDLSQRYQNCNTDDCTRQIVLISGTGEDTISEIADLKTYLGSNLLNVFLASILPDELNPRLFEYDVIATPQIEDPAVVSTLGVAHKVTNKRISSAIENNQHLFDDLKKPVFALLLGGNTMYCQGFDSQYGKQLSERVKSVVASKNGSLIITNSRRTPADVQQNLLEQLTELQPMFFDWVSSPDDLYWSILGIADAIITTGDSLSMCSEVMYTGKPLLVDISVKATESYHRDILKRLFEHGAARVLEKTYTPWEYNPVDTTGEIADAILLKLNPGN